MFKRAATDRDKQPRTTQRTPTVALINVRLLPDGCCCLSGNGNEILLRIFPQPFTTTAGLDGARLWLGHPCRLTSHQRISLYMVTLKSWFTRCQLILKMLLLPVLLRAATWHFWAHTSVSTASLSATYVVVGGRMFEHLLQIGTKYNFFFKILKWFCLISNLNQTQFDVP